MKLLILLLLISINGFGQLKLTGKETTTTPTLSFTKPQSKTDTVKVNGWVVFYEHFVTPNNGTVTIWSESISLSRHVVGDSVYYLAQQSRFGTACYVNGIIVKIILFKGQEFPLNKHYEFLRDDEILK